VTAVRLHGVPETMLWPLHCRANEAMRADGVLADSEAIRIYRSIDYPFRRNFGRPGRSLAQRANIFDHHVNAFLGAHPSGTVVELACGLETQSSRCDNGTRKWLAVDMPESIAVREQFIAPTDRNRHLAKSALDLAWISEVDPRHGVCVTAQGLLMYLPETEVHTLITAIVTKISSVVFVFDCIPYWLKVLGAQGFPLTMHYRSPPMRWGAQPAELEQLLRPLGAVATSTTPYAALRGPLQHLASSLLRVPFSSAFSPVVVGTTGRC
jgi:O-methyltransferase involved in polyketide biosynthesis